jgi:hypothetical protein
MLKMSNTAGAVGWDITQSGNEINDTSFINCQNSLVGSSMNLYGGAFALRTQGVTICPVFAFGAAEAAEEQAIWLGRQERANA